MSCTKPDYQSFAGEDAVFLDLGDNEDTESPWEGAVIYKRNASISHVEYCTTLERLGLENLSTEVSKSRASVMGLRVTKAVKDYPQGTPVQISIDITRKKQKLRLDGIIKTVITLTCSRCGEPAAECIFSNFALLLTDEPIEEPDIINLGVMYGDNSKTYTEFADQEEEDDEAAIDFEDQLYFRPDEKEIDISKHIRDAVHLEITIAAVCDPSCKGLCLGCGRNLNTSSCTCSKKDVKKGLGPLGNLKKQMQQK
ncbi:large ribosomal RNA subunit accumulation protein YCED homolog 1, chloroplastic isoform X2 [Malus domestica]